MAHEHTEGTQASLGTDATLWRFKNINLVICSLYPHTTPTQQDIHIARYPLCTTTSLSCIENEQM